VRKPSVQKSSIIPAWQFRAARAAADVSIQTLAERSQISVSTIRRAERDGSGPMSRISQKALLDALTALGVTLSEPGVAPATVSMAPPPTDGAVGSE